MQEGCLMHSNGNPEWLLILIVQPSAFGALGPLSKTVGVTSPAVTHNFLQLGTYRKEEWHYSRPPVGSLCLRMPWPIY
jgi:hypothetical protein